MNRSISLLIALAICSSCATLPASQKSEKVELNKQFMTQEFRQHGQPVDEDAIWDQLKRDPITEPLMSSRVIPNIGKQVLGYTGVLTIFGAGLVGKADQSKAGVIVGGVALVAAAFVLDWIQYSQLEEAVRLHNHELEMQSAPHAVPAKKPTGGLRVSPSGLAWVF